MKTNGKIQLYPMVRMTVLLILGMVTAYYTSSHIPSWLWLGGTLILLLMTPLVRQELRQSVVVMLLVFLFGGCLMSRSLLLASSPTDTIETSPSMTQRAQANALELRNQLVNTLSDKGLEQQELAVVSAMTLGDKSLIDKDLKNDYSRSGASHVLALSGLHLGIIYFVFSFSYNRKSSN